MGSQMFRPEAVAWGSASESQLSHLQLKLNNAFSKACCRWFRSEIMQNEGTLLTKSSVFLLIVNIGFPPITRARSLPPPPCPRVQPGVGPAEEISPAKELCPLLLSLCVLDRSQALPWHWYGTGRDPQTSWRTRGRVPVHSPSPGPEPSWPR